MLCVSVAVWSKNAKIAYSRVAIVIREKFIRLKALGIEVQGHKHGSFFFLYDGETWQIKISIKQF